MKAKLVSLLFPAGILFIVAGVSVWNIPQKSSNNTDKTIKPTISVTATQSLKPSATIQKPSTAIKPKTNLRQVYIVNVLDGDTVITSTGDRIRYLGINAPEKGQPYSTLSTAKNKDLILNKTVGLEFDVAQKDRYGRTLAYIFLGNTFVNLEMVNSGLAVSETIPPNVKYQDLILSAQKTTRDACRGMWENYCFKDNSKNTSCLSISTIYANPPGDDNKNKNGEWIEFKNTCQNSVSMNNWLLKDNSASNKYEFKNFSLPENQSIRLHSGCGQNSNTDLFWSCPEPRYAIWNNSGDHAYLYNEKQNLVADYSY